MVCQWGHAQAGGEGGAATMQPCQLFVFPQLHGGHPSLFSCLARVTHGDEGAGHIWEEASPTQPQCYRPATWPNYGFKMWLWECIDEHGHAQLRNQTGMQGWNERDYWIDTVKEPHHSFVVNWYFYCWVCYANIMEWDRDILNKISGIWICWTLT